MHHQLGAIRLISDPATPGGTSARQVHTANTAAWRKALERAGIENFRWHDLRHTWASWHVQSGTPLHALQEMGGWQTATMAQRYAHLAPEHLSEHASRIETPLRTFFGTPEKEKAA